MKLSIMKVLCLAIILCIIPLSSSIAQTGGVTDSVSLLYDQAISLLCSGSLLNQKHLEDVEQYFSDASGYQLSFEYQLFTEALLIMLNDDVFAYDDALDIIQLINGNEAFIRDYSSHFDKSDQKILPDLYSVSQYIEARKYEADGDIEAAVALYSEYSVLDASIRAYSLSSELKIKRYNMAKNLLADNTLNSCTKAAEIFKELGSYGDSRKRLNECNAQMNVLLSDWVYKIENDEVIITGYIGKDINLTVPATINSYPVRKIGDAAFQYNSTIRSISLPESLIAIGEVAFDQCFGLQEIIIPGKVETIGNCAFGNCHSLTQIVIPGNIERLNENVFWACYNLKAVAMLEGISQIGNTAFGLCSSLSNVYIPDSVTKISADAFEDCQSLKHIYVFSGSWAEKWLQSQKWAKNLVVNPNPASDFRYEITNNTVTILEYLGTKQMIVIPWMIAGKAVTQISDSILNSHKVGSTLYVPPTVLINDATNVE